MPTQVYLSLGSNLNNPQQQLETAFIELNQLPKTQLVKKSSLWSSQPIGPQDQPDFINAAALISTQLEPLELLDQLQGLEKKHQRKKLRHWGERTLDLDIISYGNLVLTSPRLNLPHPEAKNRAFVLLPLAEINPQLVLPALGSLNELITALPKQQLVKL